MMKSVGAGGANPSIKFQEIDLEENPASEGIANPGKPKFIDMLKDGIKEVNAAVKGSEKASMDLVSGKSSNIHETMLAVSKAEIGFNMLVQMRNKAIEAYQDVMRMQV